MNIAVIGATGRTGALVVEQALARGDRVTALARRPDAVATRHPNLVTAYGDVLDPESVAVALRGCDAVVSAVGTGTSRAPTVTYSEGIDNVLAAMWSASITRIAVVSAAPVGPRDDQPFLERRVMMPILDRFFGTSYTDMRRMEERLTQSDVDWVSLRPPRLVGKPATGAYRIGAAPLRRAMSLTYGDLATALLDSLGRTDLYRHPVFVAN